MSTAHDAAGRLPAAPQARENGGNAPERSERPTKSFAEAAPRIGRVFLLHLESFSANESQTLAVAESLLTDGWDAHIICRASSRLGVDARARNIPVHSMADDVSGGLGTAWGLLRKLKQAGGKDTVPILIHACDPAASALASRLWRMNKKLRIVHTRRVPVMESSSKGMRCYQTPPAKVVTDSLAGKIALRLSGLEPHLLHTIPCGIDPSVYSGREPRSDGRIIFAMTGELIPRRGHAELFAALPPLATALMGTPWEVRVLGDGPHFATLLAEAEAKGVAHRLAFLSGIDPKDELCHCDALILPAPEGESYMPRILEGWAVNLPVVAVNRLDHAEILEDNVNCLLVRPGDAEHLATCMARVATDEALRDRLTAGGRESLARFTLAAMTAEHRRLYREILA